MGNPIVTIATESNKSLIANLWQLFMHDLARFNPILMDKEGRFDYDEHQSLDGFWKDGNRTYLFFVEEQPVGFAVICECPGGCEYDYSMDSFFVASPFRRRGIGSKAAKSLLDSFNGRWFICQPPLDDVAISFWRNIVHDANVKDFTEVTKAANGLPCSRFYFVTS